MKTKYIEIIDLVLTNPANQLSKSSRDMLETMKNGLRLDIMKNELKIEKEDHSEEMLSMLEDCMKSLEYVYKNTTFKTISEGYEDEIENILYRKQELEILINKVKDNG